MVVGSVDTGDADRIVRLLTAGSGRVSVVVRRARSRTGAGTALGARLRVVVASAREGLYSARSVESVTVPVRARDSLVRIAFLAYGCEVCASLAPEHAPAPKLQGLLEAWLGLLEAAQEPTAVHRWALEAKALTFAGLAPALLRCAACGDELEGPVTFDPEVGGGRHARCGSGRAVPVDALRWLDRVRRTPLVDLPPAPPPAAAGLSPWLLADFVEHQLGRPLSSRGFLTGAP